MAIRTMTGNRISSPSSLSHGAKPGRTESGRSKSHQTDEILDWILHDDGPITCHRVIVDLLQGDQFDPRIAMPDDGICWLRFRATDSDARQIISFSRGTTYKLTSSNALIRIGENVPTAALPALNWLPLATQIERELPAAIYPDSIRESCTHQSSHPIAQLATADVPLQIELIPASQSKHPAPRPAEAILVQTRELCEWADLASARRISRLAWVQIGEQALVIGQPLPPIAGKYFAKAGRILVPAGKWWSPNLPISLVQRVFDERVECPQQLTHLWQIDRTVLSIPSDQFETLRRAAVRASVERIE